MEGMVEETVEEMVEGNIGGNDEEQQEPHGQTAVRRGRGTC